MGGGGADAFHLVGSDGDADSGTAEQDGPVSGAVPDHLAGGNAHVRVGPAEVIRRVAPVDADVDDLADTRIVPQVREDLVLVVHAGFVRADNEPQPHDVSFRCHDSAATAMVALPSDPVAPVKCGPMTAKTMASDVAP